MRTKVLLNRVSSESVILDPREEFARARASEEAYAIEWLHCTSGCKSSIFSVLTEKARQTNKKSAALQLGYAELCQGFPEVNSIKGKYSWGS